MTIRPPYRPSRLFQFAARTFRYFLLAIFGLVLSSILLVVFGGWDILMMMLKNMSVWLWLGRVTVTIALLMLVAIVVESLHSGN